MVKIHASGKIPFLRDSSWCELTLTKCHFSIGDKMYLLLRIQLFYALKEFVKSQCSLDFKSLYFSCIVAFYMTNGVSPKEGN